MLAAWEIVVVCGLGSRSNRRLSAVGAVGVLAEFASQCCAEVNKSRIDLKKHFLSIDEWAVNRLGSYV